MPCTSQHTIPELLTYGLRDGKFFHIDKVEKGLACGCVCPSCGSPLEAKNQGLIHQHHFAHAKGQTNCKGAQMTVLHRMAQEILEEEKKVMLPEYKGEYVHHPAVQKKFVTIASEHTIPLNNGYLRTDVMAVDDKGAQLSIEIYVTHKVDGQKQESYKNACIDCMEIDLRDFKDKDFAKDELREYLLNNSEHRSWRHNRAYEEEEARKKAEAEAAKKQQIEEGYKALAQQNEDRFQCYVADAKKKNAPYEWMPEEVEQPAVPQSATPEKADRNEAELYRIVETYRGRVGVNSTCFVGFSPNELRSVIRCYGELRNYASDENLVWFNKVVALAQENLENRKRFRLNLPADQREKFVAV